ncbi:MAG: hypothetical protein PT947_01500 [Suipraeoptans intestinalis]|nr:hypothetical protein [Suipraeoptans intestinalis]
MNTSKRSEEQMCQWVLARSPAGACGFLKVEISAGVCYNDAGYTENPKKCKEIQRNTGRRIDLS